MTHALTSFLSPRAYLLRGHSKFRGVSHRILSRHTQIRPLCCRRQLTALANRCRLREAGLQPTKVTVLQQRVVLSDLSVLMCLVRSCWLGMGAVIAAACAQGAAASGRPVPFVMQPSARLSLQTQLSTAKLGSTAQAHWLCNSRPGSASRLSSAVPSLAVQLKPSAAGQCRTEMDDCSGLPTVPPPPPSGPPA